MTNEGYKHSLPSPFFVIATQNPSEFHGTYEFRKGPVFTNVLLADEINRTSPRTQSALLEVMSEYHLEVFYPSMF